MKYETLYKIVEKNGKKETAECRAQENQVAAMLKQNWSKTKPKKPVVEDVAKKDKESENKSKLV